MSDLIPVEDLKTLISYDPETGALTWRERKRELFPSEGYWRRWNTRFAGKLAGGEDGSYLDLPGGHL